MDIRVAKIGEGQELKMLCGVPQVSAQGPLLWNIYYDGMLRIVLPECVQPFGYADYLTVMVRGRSKKEMEALINESIATIWRWMKNNSKTKVTLLVARNSIKEF